MKSPRVEFSQTYLLEPLESDPSYMTRKMFGGLAVYFRGLMVLCLVENPGDRMWQGKRYPYPLWNGLLIPTTREAQESLVADLPGVAAHPVLGKWLYLPLTEDDYEATAMKIIERLRRGDPRLGVVPGSGRRARAAKLRKVQRRGNA